MERAVGEGGAPVATVVVPAYNDAATISAVLEGLEQQDLSEPFEIVVVASGGDPTPHIVRRDFPSTVLYHSPDRLTPGAARNVGVDAARGEFIAFLAADCVPHPQWLRRRVEAHRAGHALVGGFVDSRSPSTLAGWSQYLAKFWTMQGLHRAAGVGPGPLFHLSYALSALVRRWDETATAGEDTAFNDALVHDGHVVWFDSRIRCYHVNARRRRDVLTEQWEQGHAIGRLTSSGQLPQYFAPLRGGPHMPFVLGWRCVTTVARYRPLLLPRCLLVLPLTIQAMATRRRGFQAGYAEGPPDQPLQRPLVWRVPLHAEPTITAIVPAYNEERVIAACIDSLHAQTTPELEVIVVDDGSTDRTGRIARDRGVRVLHVPHGGPAAAKNAGAEAARGRVLVFFDADLTADHDAIERLCQPIVSGHTLGTFTADIVVANPENPWADCWTANRGAQPGHHFRDPLPARWANFRAVRRDDFLEAGGFDDVGYGEDTTLAPKVGALADLVPGARFWHHNPSTLREVWQNARWVGRGPVITARRQPPRYRDFGRTVRRGLLGARRLGRPRYMLFALVYDVGLLTGYRSARRGRKSHAK